MHEYNWAYFLLQNQNGEYTTYMGLLKKSPFPFFTQFFCMCSKLKTMLQYSECILYVVGRKEMLQALYSTMTWISAKDTGLHSIPDVLESFVKDISMYVTNPRLRCFLTYSGPSPIFLPLSVYICSTGTSADLSKCQLTTRLLGSSAPIDIGFHTLITSV